MLFGKRHKSVAPQKSGSAASSAQQDMYLVAYDRMLKGNKLTRRGRPIRQVAVVVNGTVMLITSGDAVDKKTYEALVTAGALAPDGSTPITNVPVADDGVPDDAESA